MPPEPPFISGVMPRNGPIEEWVQQESAAWVPRMSRRPDPPLPEVNSAAQEGPYLMGQIVLGKGL
jgi:hypothetical protein